MADEDTEEYRITIIPIQADGKVRYRGVDFTTSVQRHNVIIKGVKYYIRQSGKQYKDLQEAIEGSLETIFKNLEINEPVTVSIKREQPII